MNTTITAISQLEAAIASGKLSASAGANIGKWLKAPYLRDYAPQVADHLAAGRWPELEDAFWTTIPFGTGGRRGRMYPIGCNAINDRTIGESAQGLADYIRDQAAASTRPRRAGLSCAIAYDTRHRSRHFAELCSEIMAAAGVTVYFLDGFRSTPELSFTVRRKQCDCGIMITASHNPPSDNAVKVYGPSGGQMVPPQDAESIDRMEHVTFIRRMPFAEALAAGRVICCQQEIDAAFVDAVLVQSVEGPRDLKVLYSPLHGVGASAVLPVLARAGFRDVELFGPHAPPDGDFPNVPHHVANPENPAVFQSMIRRAEETGAELILATDPDGDRLGCAARKSLQPNAAWATLTGNQLGALLVDFLLAGRKAAGTLAPQNFVVKTVVTTELIRRIAEHWGVAIAGDLNVGFKWIAAEIDARGPETFAFAAEESYGFLAGDHVRDKDAAVAALLTAELAAALKRQGKTLCQRLDELYAQYGCYAEGQVSIQMPGERGMQEMQSLMARLRASPPEALAGLRVVRVRDYLAGRQNQLAEDRADGWISAPLAGPNADLVILDLESPAAGVSPATNSGRRRAGAAIGSNYVAMRPSGTEPKIKIYTFAHDAPSSAASIESTKAAQAARLDSMAADFRRFAGV
jgi:phosphoglucomutase/phosphomannomutase